MKFSLPSAVVSFLLPLSLSSFLLASFQKVDTLPSLLSSVAACSLVVSPPRWLPQRRPSLEGRRRYVVSLALRRRAYEKEKKRVSTTSLPSPSLAIAFFLQELWLVSLPSRARLFFRSRARCSSLRRRFCSRLNHPSSSL